MARYVFVDEWRLAADVETVWTVTRRLEEWPRWWPSVRSVTLLDPGSETGVGAIWRFVFSTRLPYSMGWELEIVRVDLHALVEARVRGRIDGSGRWGVQEIPGGTLLRFDWVVTPRPAWMRVLSPLARPLFSWNHRALMTEGGEGLARHLGVPLLAEIVSTSGS